MSFLLIVVLISNLFAQEKKNSFLKEYYSAHMFVQYTYNLKGVVIKQDHTVNYDVLSYITPQFGLLFNVFQSNNWNFKTGIIIKTKMFVEKFLFTKKQTGSNFNFGYIVQASGDDDMWSIPFIGEYIYHINKKTKWMIAPSFTISSYREYGAKTQTGYGPPPTAIMFLEINNRANKPIHTSAEISTGFYFLFKHFMLQPEFRFSKSFSTLKSGRYVTKNFRTNPESSQGTFTQSGDYWGVSLSIYLKKKQKNKK